MHYYFDLLHLYYLPQYEPVIAALIEQGHEVNIVAHQTDDPLLNLNLRTALTKSPANIRYVAGWEEALTLYLYEKPAWIIFGNAVNDLDKLHQHSKTALMQHGVGPKSCYYTVSENPTSVRFVEGQLRLNNLQQRYPNGHFVDTGYAKLDAAINGTASTLTHSDLGLDPTKPTLLYAPTFYPSSIERFAKDFPTQFAQYNIILKPHFFSLTKDKYKKQAALLKHWAQADNVYLAPVDEYNLVPFMQLADVLLSEASSTVFEFAALDKPVVWCDFYKLRWSYSGIFSFRFKKRLDDSIEIFHTLCERADSYAQVKTCIEHCLTESADQSAVRARVTEEFVGAVDGQCALRIAAYLTNN